MLGRSSLELLKLRLPTGADAANIFNSSDRISNSALPPEGRCKKQGNRKTPLERPSRDAILRFFLFVVGRL
jgi:hypothetical protein